MRQRIYLDNNASTPLDPLVLEAVIEGLKEDLGNPSSIHFHGQKSRQRLEKARQTIAKYLKVRPPELIFTSGGTEGANLLLRGIINGSYSGHVISSDAEHSCIYQTLKDFEKRGVEVSYLPAGLWGAVKPETVREAIRPNTRLIALMAVNNETGVKTDIEAIAAIALEARIPFIVDGVALLGKEAFSIPAGIAAMFFSGHKLHAPKGVGVVFCRSSLRLSPLFVGNQEFTRRAGTENLPGILGLAKAIEILQFDQSYFSSSMKRLRDKLEEGIKAGIGEIVINGQGPRVMNTTNISFLGVDGESLLMNLDMEGVSVSHGSACSSGAIEPSRVLINMNIPLAQARSAIRLSLSRFTTEQEIDQAIEIIVRVAKRLKQLKK